MHTSNYSKEDKNRNCQTFYTPSDQHIGQLYAMHSAHKSPWPFKTPTIKTTFVMPLENKNNMYTLTSMKDQEGYVTMIENFHETVIYSTPSMGTFMFLILLTLRTVQMGYGLCIYTRINLCISSA